METSLDSISAKFQAPAELEILKMSKLNDGYLIQFSDFSSVVYHVERELSTEDMKFLDQGKDPTTGSFLERFGPYNTELRTATKESNISEFKKYISTATPKDLLQCSKYVKNPEIANYIFLEFYDFIAKQYPTIILSRMAQCFLRAIDERNDPLIQFYKGNILQDFLIDTLIEEVRMKRTRINFSDIISQFIEQNTIYDSNISIEESSNFHDIYQRYKIWSNQCFPELFFQDRTFISDELTIRWGISEENRWRGHRLRSESESSAKDDRFFSLTSI